MSGLSSYIQVESHLLYLSQLESTMSTLNGLTLLLFLVTAAATVSVATAQTCNACNCQFNNVQALSKLIDELIDAKVNQSLSDEPRKLFTEF